MQSCGRRQPVKGDWRAFNRAPIAAYAVETLDRLPAPATKSIQAIKAASDRGLAAFHVPAPLEIRKSFPPGLARPAAHETSATRGAVLPGKFLPSHFFSAGWAKRVAPTRPRNAGPTRGGHGAPKSGLPDFGAKMCRNRQQPISMSAFAHPARRAVNAPRKPSRRAARALRA